MPHIVRDRIARTELAELAAATFGDMVKAVVDVERRVLDVRPSQGNRSRGVDDEEVKEAIRTIVAERIDG